MDTMRWDKVEGVLAERNIRQRRIAEVMEVPEQRVSEWKSGKKWRPNLDQALKLARCLDVSLEWLIDDREELPPPAPLLSPEEAKILDMVRTLGPEEARRRLMLVHLGFGEQMLPIARSGTGQRPADPGPSGEHQPAKRPKSPGKC